jgi:uncharacterized membrane protein
MDLLFASLLVIHISAAATWVGGATMLELVFQPRVSAISNIQGALVSRRIETRVTVMSWTCLVLISVTGVALSVLQGTFNLGSLLQPTGLFLLASIILTAVAVASGLLITFYTPRLQSVKAAETNIRSVVRALVRLNNVISLAAVVLMVVFTELIKVQG